MDIDNTDLDEIFKITLKKKTKKKGNSSSSTPTESPNLSRATSPEPIKSLEKIAEEEYTFLLDRILAITGEKNTVSLKLPPPDVVRENTIHKILNFDAIIKVLNRDPMHFSAFLDSELSVSSNLNAERHLLIRGRGRYDSTKIRSIISKYVLKYIKCGACSSYKTRLIKEDKLQRVLCADCSAVRSV